MTQAPAFAAALEAHAAGLAVLPPKQDGSKRPDGEWKQYQATAPTIEQLHAWYEPGRTGIGLITGSVSGNLELLEFEGRAIDEEVHKAFARLADAAGLGELVARIRDGYFEATPSGGRHLLYRVDGPVAGNTKLARRPATAAELAEDPDDRIKVLIETRGNGGYVITAPSNGAVHPTGAAWSMVSGSFATITTITTEERDQLHELARALDQMPRPAAISAPRSSSDERPGDVYNQAPDAPQRTLDLLERHGWAPVWRVAHQGHEDVHLRRPGKAQGTSAVLHMDAGTLVVFSTSTAFDTEVGYDPFGVLTKLEHGGDFSAAARALRPEGPPRDDITQLLGASLNPDVRPDTQPSSVHLPEEFWTARPVLEHIRQAARCRLVSPDAVFGVCLVRIAAITPHTVELPPTVSGALGLTSFSGLVGPPSSGKSAAVPVAAELLPAPAHIPDRLPIGSGEGMVEVLFDLVTEDDPETGKKIKVKRPVKNAAIFHIDEGVVLTDLGGRQGSTLLSTLRSAWSHAPLGNTNASAERRRILPGDSYVYGISLGIQPEKAAALLSDGAAGTPQRFVWFMATDPGADEAELPWPGALPWAPPDAGDLEPLTTHRGGWKRHPLVLDASIRAEVRRDRAADTRAEGSTETGEEHRNLRKLKVAALLAILDGRLDVDLEDWALAELVIATSTHVRRSVEATLASLQARKEVATIERHARRESYVDTTKEQRALESAAKSLARVVRKHADAEQHAAQGGGCTRSCITTAIAKKHRDLVGVDDPMHEAERLQWIASRDERWFPGESKPA